MKQKKKKNTYSLCTVVVLVIFSVFSSRLVSWQLINAEKYRSLARSDSAEEVKSAPVRGEILDKNGKGLIVNQIRYKVVVDSSAVNDPDFETTLGKLKSLFDKIGENRSADMTAASDGGRYVFADNISQRAVSAIAENIGELRGVELIPYYVREATEPTLAPHILGALGAITAEEYDELKDAGNDYDINDKTGKFGIESAYENVLRGKSGKKLVYRDPDGKIESEELKTEAERGGNVWLTIDSELQRTAVKSLAENVNSARKEGKTKAKNNSESGCGEDCEAGAVVMLSVRDFSVLAAASYPTYDLNRYSRYGEYYNSLAQSESAPMFDRAFFGTYACGSVFKPCTALAALESGTITPETEFCCTKYYDYYPSNVVECMHRHGNENVTSAMAHSCNWFFAETGRRLGISAIDKYAETLGLGVPTGIETGESTGILAGRFSTDWQAGNTVQAAIGQSDNAFTPLQLAAYTATLANNGTRLKTHIVDKITSCDGKTVIEDRSAPVTLSETAFSEKNLKVVQNAMLKVARDPEGTAYSVFGDYKIDVAAKTGTAENAGSDHAVFICYAPFDDPKAAIAVVIEHGVSGKYAMQVARDLLNEYFKQDFFVKKVEKSQKYAGN